MFSLFSDHVFRKHFALFILFHFLLYFFLIQFHSLVPFSSTDYFKGSHHFLPDPQSQNRPFNLFSALAQYDSQWYLKIASDGYCFSPAAQTILDKTSMCNLTLAYFPLFPLLISLAHFLISNIEIAAFVTTHLILIAAYTSLYFILSRLFSKSLAVKTTWLLFLNPFSIFFRSYYPDCLFLLLLAWSVYFLITKRFLLTSVFASFLILTKGLAFFIVPYFIIKSPRRLSLLVPPLLAAGIILVHNYLTTGNPFTFYFILGAWGRFSASSPLIQNLTNLLLFDYLPLHGGHLSQLDFSVAIAVFFLLVLSRRRLPPAFWWTSFLIWLIPLISTDLMSYSRYQSVSFPLFLFLSQKLSRLGYSVILIIFLALLLFTSLYFVNWRWIG